MSRGCLRLETKRCGVQDFIRGYADDHLCSCGELVIVGSPLLDGRPVDTGASHPPAHRCDTCGRQFTLLVPVDLSELREIVAP